jgi:hypothetical protein
MVLQRIANPRLSGLPGSIPGVGVHFILSGIEQFLTRNLHLEKKMNKDCKK